MLEILVLMFLGKAIGKIAAAKGRSVGGYKALVVLLWFGGEIGGGVGALIAGLEGAPIYLLALGGAIAGAIVAFVIANAAAPLTPVATNITGGFPVIQSPPPRR